MVATKCSGARSLSTPGVLLSKRGQLPRAVAWRLRTSTFTVTMAFISMAVPETSPSPCAQCTSPTDSPQPSMKQGKSSVVPLTICFTSVLPPFSRGGMVRRHRSFALPVGPQRLAGTASVGSGGSTNPCFARSSSSREKAASISGRPSSTPMVPANPCSGSRTPGRSLEVAYRVAPVVVAGPSSQCAMAGSVNLSRRNPKPGTATVYPKLSGPGPTSIIVTASTSPRLAPLTCSGPVRGWMRFKLAAATVAGVDVRLNGLSNASRVSKITVSPALASAASGMSGCQRL